MRLAGNGHKGFPLVASHWYLHEGGYFYCAIHQDSLMASLLKQDPLCGFEIAPDTIPYHGVRGQGRVILTKTGAGELLERLIHRYLEGTDSTLARWLLSRADQEYAVRIAPTWVTSWDFSHRM